MLSVRVVAPADLLDSIAAELSHDPTVCAIVRIAETSGAQVLLFEVARENANNVVRLLRHAGVPAVGSIVVSEPLVVVSDAATAAEARAPGHPDDGVVWAHLAAKAREDARPSASFFIFLFLATALAGIGRLLDQPILIIGAMVVGPEFAPVAAVCFAVVRRRAEITGPALATLFGGFAGCAALAAVLWWIAYLCGVMTYEQATTGPLTDFIVSPDGWSFVVAIIAGIAGVLSLTTAKSTALVGAFISVTTVPAVGTIGLTLAVGAWSEAGSAALQLMINVAGLLIAGIATLWIQLQISRRLGRRTAV